MATVHMSEAEVVRDFHAVLDKLNSGDEVIVEQGSLPVAVIRSVQEKGRLLSESIAIAKALGSDVTLDDEFGKDVEEGIRERSRPWNPPSWD